jgi:hypothetical protein
MPSADSKAQAALGFLTIIEREPHGLLGGYLLLNLQGRPLEFHCTAPIKPNRAQEILFGPTLESFLYGEQIGQTLINKAGASPQVVVTDRRPALTVREYVQTPVVLISSESAPGASQPQVARRVDGKHANVHGPAWFDWRACKLAVHASWQADERLARSRLDALAEHLDLSEPFERIRAAIDEAQRGPR